MPLRSSRFASLVYIDREWFASNPASAAAVRCDWPSKTLLCLLACLSVSGADVVDVLREAGVSAEAQQSLIDSLVSAGFVVTDERSAALEHMAADSVWFEALRYFSMRSAVPYTDYTDPEVYRNDASRMRAYLAESAYPPIYKCYPEAPRVPLPAYDVPATDLRSLMGQLLFWCFGRLREATFLDLLPVMLKPVPSKGARHPFEAYVAVPGARGLQPGLYHYDVAEHALARIGKHHPSTPCHASVLFISVIYERVQWRYRDGWSYKDVFYDLGHVIAQLREVANHREVAIRPVECSLGGDVEMPLVEEQVAAFAVEGDICN